MLLLRQRCHCTQTVRLASPAFPQVALLYAWVGAAIAAGVYSTKRVMLSNIDGAYWDVELRGDVMKQAEAAGTSDQIASGKCSLWYRIAQVMR
jgi:hypothetical protein